MKNIFRIFSYLKFFKREIFWNVFFNLLYVLFSLFSFVAIIPFISVLFGVITPPDVCPDWAWNSADITDYLSWHIWNYKEQAGIFPCLLWIGGAYLFFVFCSAGSRYMGTYFLSPIRNGMIEYLRNDLYEKITILPLSFFQNKHRGDLLSRMTADLADVEWSVVSTLQMLIKDPLNVLVFVAFLFVISPKLTLFVLCVMPIAALLTRRIGGSLKRNSEKGQKQMGTMMSHLEESLSGIRMIKAFGIERTVINIFNVLNNEYCRLMTKIYRRRELASPLTEVFAVLAMLAVIVFGGSLVINNELHPGILIGFVLIFMRIISPLQSVTTSYYNLQKGSAAAARLYEILDAEERIKEVENPVPIKKFERAIEYRDVFFSYDDKPSDSPRYVLRGINATIEKGQTVALVGSSGSGKTTMANLLPRFYDVTHGDLVIDGQSIKDLVISDVRTLIGWVAQDSILFHDSVINNIAFGDPHPNEEKVKQAAKVAYADEFIEKLPNGYYTRLGDEGLNLSGGQRQRICIARAIYKDPPVLVLDEATSALDTESEKMVQNALTNLMKNRTSIVIAHRLSTIVHADRIIVLGEGQIIESGTHQSLLAKNGKYADMVRMQSL